MVKKKRRWQRLPDEVVSEVRRLDALGLSEQQIVEAVGVGKGSVHRVRHRRADVVGPVEPWQPRRGCLTLEDRVQIAVGLGRGETFTAIGARVGVAVSSISREVGGCRGRRSYDAAKAHRRAQRAARRPKCRRLDVSSELRRRVVELLEAWWSPEQIAARLRCEFPDRPEMWVSHETIYQSLYVQGRGELRKDLARCLRTGRARRRSRRESLRRGPIPDPVPISERPAEVEDRAVPGHWEGDLIFGAGTRHAFGTLVERQTRFVMLLHLPNGHSAENVRAAMAAKITDLPAELVKTITWDRGVEMARHQALTIDTGVEVYFCDPHSPWQRGSNENTNGLLRQYFPKGSDFSTITAEDLDQAAASLNSRPRKTLDWRTPAEALTELLAPTP
ncbi:IS30 family transposase [Iamia majanohamensis]|uniref:IS30 family transposase n=1 Tax=Iamia majanohamensis TaxID=467976 RepID=A0AAE9Y6J5_9ACTN|nr:IS30 family transposase [Iamia majanohamensis]WCO66739.1 IS30 family transposase [Iamia majanohamensis]WCO67850.1 IS30 family transposase [Iamia majanohamensis]